MRLIKKIIHYFLFISLMTMYGIQSYAQSGCNNDQVLNFTDANIDWTHNAQSGTFTVGAQTFDISIDDSDHIFKGSGESDEGLEIYIDPNDKHDVLTITYDLSETANQVSFPIRDLDKKSGGSSQQEQVCVYGYLGNSPIPIMPMITSLEGSVSIDGNCATATTNSATSGEDESVFVQFDECIDRVVIEYGSGSMAPDHPTGSRIFIGEGTGFSSNVCDCGEACTTENTLDFSDSGINWVNESLTGTYNVGSQTYTIDITDPDGILESTQDGSPYSVEYYEGLKIGINPHSNDDIVTLSYCLSEVSNRVYFQIRDLDKKSSASNQQEQVCVYGLLGDDATRILPMMTSLEGSVSISQNADGVCGTATANSAISGQDESVFVQFDECIDKVIIEYGSGPMAPDNPTYSTIYIGEGFGFYTGVCGTECTPTCEAAPGTLSGGEEVCLFASSGVPTADISATANNDAVVPAGYQVAYVLTSGSDLVIEATNSTPDFTIDATGLYTIHTLVYDPATLNLGIIQLGTTMASEVVELLIQGGGTICAALDVAGTSFNAVTPDAGTLTANGETSICLQGGSINISATSDNNAVIPAGYEVRYVLTSGNNLVIEEVSNTPGFSVDGSGRYTIHTLVYNPATLDLNTIQIGVTTGAEVNSSLVSGGGGTCGDLDVTGAVFLLADPNAGGLTPNATSACFISGGNINISATPDGNAVVPTGYQIGYVLTSSTGVIVQPVSSSPNFSVGVEDTYTIHTLVYNPATLDTGTTITPGTTTASQVNNLLVQGGAGGTVCAALDLTGATLPPLTEISAGGLTPNAVLPCSGGATTISAIPDGSAVVPAGYQIGYVLTSAGVIISNIEPSPAFNINSIGTYTIHTLVYDPATIGTITPGTTTADEVDDLLIQGNAGGTVCGALDLTGADFIIANCFIIDNDWDNDGISNIQEGNGVDPSADDDNDGIPNYQDPDYPNFTDINNDGINDRFDKDLDGTADIFDLDSDNDGIADIVEAGGQDADLNGDGIVDVFIDADGDGWTDTYDNDDDTTPQLNDGTGTPLPNDDDDKDGLPNFIDLDSDSDGIADIIEAGGMDTDGDGYVDNAADIDGDGYADIVDTDNNNISGGGDGGTALPSPDSDGDGRIDALDLDSDNDGVTDLSEAGGTDNDSDGQLDVIIDTDGDGLANSVDTDNNNIAGPGDGGTALESPDSDGDGRTDATDLDSDNDGIADIIEAGGQDSNQDGYIDDPTDTDNDGLAEIVDPNDNTIPGSNDGSGTALANPDTDNDGFNDLIDLDSDHDELPDIMEAGIRDENGDGMIDNTTDTDNDGYVDVVDADNNNIAGSNDGGLNGDGVVAIEFIIDTDGDAVPNYLDLDSDNDGMSDIMEAGGRDGDNNGITDAPDSDKDGLADSIDPDDNTTPGPNDGVGIPLYVMSGNFVGFPNKDEDGQPNFLDLDSDNDGISDLCEATGDMPTAIIRDANNDGILDGIDADGDGMIDGDDFDNTVGHGGASLTAADSDNDFRPDHLDIDADADGIVDLVEIQTTLNYLLYLDSADNDADNDGINDGLDSDNTVFGGFAITTIVDTDGDAIPDYLDTNSDNDTEDDNIEGFDYDGDGIAEAGSIVGTDIDNDGLDDGYDKQTLFFDSANDSSYADTLPDTDNTTDDEKDWRTPCLSVQLSVFMEGAMTKLTEDGFNTEMRANLAFRGVLPGQIPIDLTLDTTAAGQPYDIAPWDYEGREGEDWDDSNYDQILAQFGQEVVDWVLVSFRRTTAVESQVAKTAALALQDGTVVFVEDCFLSTFDTELYIVVEHRNHMGVMTQDPVPIVSGRMVYDFRTANSYVGPNPDLPIGFGQIEVLPGIFAMYGGDGEQVIDANVPVGASYDVNGADREVWAQRNGRFAVYLPSDYDMNGDTNGADKIIWDRHNGISSRVPR